MRLFVLLVALQLHLLHKFWLRFSGGKSAYVVAYVPNSQVDDSWYALFKLAQESSQERNDGQGTTNQFFVSKACGFGLLGCTTLRVAPGIRWSRADDAVGCAGS